MLYFHSDVASRLDFYLHNASCLIFHVLVVSYLQILLWTGHAWNICEHQPEIKTN